mmetsp:Transcript_20540/g.46541  ORF Transcript_20540/g.46541 Transcript_20540/m.46541 type:complete len:534 (-) Transcript_20540:92-1693(-)
MAVFTGAAGGRIMPRRDEEDADDGEVAAPLMAAQPRPRRRRRWYHRPQWYTAIGLCIIACVGVGFYFTEHGGDRERANHAGFVPWSSGGRHGKEDKATKEAKQKPARQNMLAESEQTPTAQKAAPARRSSAAEPRSSRPPSRGEAKGSSRASTKSVSETRKASASDKEVQQKSSAAVRDMHSSLDTREGKRNSGVSAFNSWLDLYHKPSRTLATTLARQHRGDRGRTHNLRGGEFKAKDRKFYKQYSDFLNKDHPVGQTLRGTGLHPDSFHPHPTSASSGSDFSKWLDQSHPVDSSRPPSSQESVDQTGRDGHLSKGWYKQHNLHSSLHVGDANEHRRSQRVNEGARAQARDSPRQDNRDNRDPERVHIDRRTGTHLTLHQRNQLMESRHGDYKFLSPQSRWVRKEYDAIHDAQKARARAQLGLKHMQAAVNEALSRRSRSFIPGVWSLDSVGKPEDAGGVLSKMPEDSKLAGGVLANVQPDSNFGGVLAKVQADSTNQGALAKVPPPRLNADGTHSYDGVLANIMQGVQKQT